MYSVYKGVRSSLAHFNPFLRESPPEDHLGKATVHITDSPETWYT